MPSTVLERQKQLQAAKEAKAARLATAQARSDGGLGTPTKKAPPATPPPATPPAAASPVTAVSPSSNGFAERAKRLRLAREQQAKAQGIAAGGGAAASSQPGPAAPELSPSPGAGAASPAIRQVPSLSAPSLASEPLPVPASEPLPAQQNFKPEPVQKQLYTSNSNSSPELRATQAEAPRVATDDGLPMPAKAKVRKAPEWKFQTPGANWKPFDAEAASTIERYLLSLMHSCEHRCCPSTKPSHLAPDHGANRRMIPWAGTTSCAGSSHAHGYASTSASTR